MDLRLLQSADYNMIRPITYLVVQGAEKYTEQLPQIHIVWRFLESQSTTVIQVHRKLSRIPLKITNFMLHSSS